MGRPKSGKEVTFIDLFAGMGGFRLGFEKAVINAGFVPKCVFTSEIKATAIKTYSVNFDEIAPIDITQLSATDIPYFDYLLAGFPCQAFSSAGKREGFLDTRGTLFFEIERILQSHRPKGFILENVEGLVNHDRIDRSKPIGRTLETILSSLNNLGYQVTWAVLNSADFGLAQDRKRIFIVGRLDHKISLDGFPKSFSPLKTILEKGLPQENSKTVDLVLKNYALDELPGMSLKDKRGGQNNIHSWDINLKGVTTKRQRELLRKLLKARRNKKWGDLKGIAWMDGMPLTIEEISTFFTDPKLKEMLDDLVRKGYLSFEHPKDLVTVTNDGIERTVRMPRTDLARGYNIVAGKLSFEISKILNPEGLAPTLVATDLDKMMVIDGSGLRRLSVVEMLRLFGFPDDFKFDLKRQEIADLFGNTVPVNLVKNVSDRMLNPSDFRIVEATKTESDLEYRSTLF